MPLREQIKLVVEGANLTRLQPPAALDAMLDGGAPVSQMAALLIALRMKGETPDEIAGAAQALRSRAARVEVPLDRLIDTCGTGGDASHPFNISPTAGGWGPRVGAPGGRSTGPAPSPPGAGARTSSPPSASRWSCLRPPWRL